MKPATKYFQWTSVYFATITNLCTFIYDYCIQNIIIFNFIFIPAILLYHWHYLKWFIGLSTQTSQDQIRNFFICVGSSSFFFVFYKNTATYCILHLATDRQTGTMLHNLPQTISEKVRGGERERTMRLMALMSQWCLRRRKKTKNRKRFRTLSGKQRCHLFSRDCEDVWASNKPFLWVCLIYHSLTAVIQNGNY